MRKLLWKIIRWVLFRFDPERVHHFGGVVMQASTCLGGTPARWMSGASIDPVPSLQKTIWGLTFQNPIGLAAGFDKNASFLAALPHYGFGFAEIGTVTPRPQGGNPRPRLFRDPARNAIFNRMGFNNLGASIISQRVGQARERLPAGFVVGANIGKNKDTPLDQAPEDYRLAIEPFQGLVDYVVINVSSPNTPGLRSLQTIDSLKPIVGATQTVLQRWKKTPPLLVKLAPEWEKHEFQELLRVLEGQGVSGWVLTNTLGGEFAGGSGGWSGTPLREHSERVLGWAKEATALPVISSGGIMDVSTALQRLQTADLIQIYSGWIYQGPSFPVTLVEALLQKAKVAR